MLSLAWEKLKRSESCNREPSKTLFSNHYFLSTPRMRCIVFSAREVSQKGASVPLAATGLRILARILHLVHLCLKAPSLKPKTEKKLT